jgi:protein-S-isoprenylcysteine O-methyltransferase Ste14
MLAALAGSATALGELRELLVVLVAWAALHFKARREENILQEEFGAKFHQLSG